jgi:hypothetical protein
VAWVQGWAFDEDLEFGVTFVVEFLYDIRRREERVKSLVEQLGEDTLSNVDDVLTRYYNKTQPILNELEAIAAAPNDNWEYLIHYMYNRGEPRDGTKVVIEISPLVWLKAMIRTWGMCGASRDMKANLTPDDLSKIDAWLDGYSYWQRFKDTYPGFASLLDHLDRECPPGADHGGSESPE